MAGLKVIKEVNIEGCFNTLQYISEDQFVIKTKNGKYITEGILPYSIEDALTFCSWRDFDPKFHTLVVNDGEKERIIYNNGCFTRGYDEIGKLSEDGSRPVRIITEEGDKWFYVERFYNAKTAHPLFGPVAGGYGKKLDSRIMGYNVTCDENEDSSFKYLGWKYNQLYYNQPYSHMDEFKGLEGVNGFFYGIQFGKDHSERYRIFKQRRDSANNVISPLLSPDYYKEFNYLSEEKVFLVIFTDGNPGVLIADKLSFKYWPGTERGKYKKFEVKEGLLFATRNNGTLAIITREGTCLSVLWSEVELNGEDVRYKDYDGEYKKADIPLLDGAYKKSIDLFLKDLNVKTSESEHNEDIISEKESSEIIKDNEVIGFEDLIQGNIEYGTLSNTIELYSKNEILYTGPLSIANAPRGAKVKKGDKVFFIWIEKSLLVSAVMKAKRPKYTIFEIDEMREIGNITNNLKSFRGFIRFKEIEESDEEKDSKIVNSIIEGIKNTIIAKHGS